MQNKTNQTKLIASYFGASFGLLQIVDICIDRFDLPVSIINYLLFAIAIGFVGILFYFYLPFLSQTKKSSNKGKKSLLSVAAILLIFILSISNIFLFRESNLSDIRQEAYSTGFKKIDDFIASEDYLNAFNIADSYYKNYQMIHWYLKS